MAKEFDKFDQTYKKLAPSIARCSSTAGAATAKSVYKAFMTVTSDAERHFGESLARARNEGVTGTDLQSFAKNRHVADALKAYEVSVAQLAEAHTKAVAFAKEAQDTGARVAALITDIDKDLKSRSGRSESKAEIEKLKATLQQAAAELQKAAGHYGKIPKAQTEYAAKAQQHIVRLLKAAPEAQQTMLNDTMLPQALVDRNRKRTQSKVVALAREIAAAADDAVNVSADDVPRAKATLKAAADKLKDLKKMQQDFTTAYDFAVQKYNLPATKDGAAVKGVKDAIDKAYGVAESKVRGAVTTMRKAGV